MKQRPLSVHYLKILRALFLLLLLGVVCVCIYVPNLTKMRRLREENVRLSKRNEELRREIGELQENIKKVETDSFIWEQLARKDLGAVKEGEIVVDIRDQEE